MNSKRLLQTIGTGALVAAALTFCAGSVSASAESSDEAVKKGKELLGEERFQDAMVYLDRALSSDPNSVKALELRARTYEEMGEYKKALDDFARLINLAPDNSANFKDRALVYLKLKQYPEAIADLSKVISLGHDAMAYYTRGWAYVLIGDHQKAIDDYTKFLDECQDSGGKVDAYFNRANQYFETKQNEKALADLSNAEKLDPQRAESGGSGTRGLGEANDPLQNSLTPEYARAYYSRGLVYSSLGRFNDAVESYNRAIAINPDMPDFYKVRAEAFEKLGQHDKASADKTLATRLKNKAAEKQAAGAAKQQPTKTVDASSTKEMDLDKFELHLGQLETKVFGRQYTDDLIPERLARLEQKLLSKTQTGSYKHRLDALMLKSGQ